MDKVYQKSRRRIIWISISWTPLWLGCADTSKSLLNWCPNQQVKIEDRCIAEDQIYLLDENCKDPEPTKLLVNEKIFSCDGTYLEGKLETCSVDGQTNCLLSTNWVAVDTSQISSSDILESKKIAGIQGSLPNFASYDNSFVNNIDPWDVRYGVQIGSLTGKLKIHCRNRASSSFYNYDGSIASIPNTGVATGTTVDYWDTIDDNLASVPASVISGWTAYDCRGIEATSGDDQVWKDVTTTGDGITTSSCTATPAHCTMKDKISGQHWSKQQGSMNWSASINHCDNLSYNGFADWRLPTTKELHDALLHGIRSGSSVNWVTSAQTLNGTYISASTHAGNPIEYWYVGIANGSTSVAGKGGAASILCTRP